MLPTTLVAAVQGDPCVVEHDWHDKRASTGQCRAGCRRRRRPSKADVWESKGTPRRPQKLEQDPYRQSRMASTMTRKLRTQAASRVVDGHIASAGRDWRYRDGAARSGGETEEGAASKSWRRSWSGSPNDVVRWSSVRCTTSSTRTRYGAASSSSKRIFLPCE